MPKNKITPTSPEKLKALQKYLKQALTTQEIEFISYYVGLVELENARTKGNVCASMRAAGYKSNGKRTDINAVDASLSTRGKLILQRSGISLQMSMYAKGADMDKIADTLHAGLDATSPVTYEGTVRDKVPDYAERRKAAGDILKVLGHTAKSRVDIFHHQDTLAQGLKEEGKGGGGLFEGDPSD